MNNKALQEWLDRHHVNIVRTHATTLDGPAVGKYLQRNKFLESLPVGHAVADVALGMDLAGAPHLTFWEGFRRDVLGDIFLRPDLSTLISDGTDPDLGHCITDFADGEGNDIDICPRNTLKRMLAQLEALGYDCKATFELEFFLFNHSYADARNRGYRNLAPGSANQYPAIYYLRNAYHAKPFMDEVIKRLEWKEIPWESWNDESAVGQVELNLEPVDPLLAADYVVRTKQIMYEVAVDMDLAVTFMAKPGPGYSSGMHIHHSLRRDGNPLFFDDNAAGNRSRLLNHWLGGLMQTMPASVSYLCPTVNAYRRMVDFAAAPVATTWGEENKSAAIRLVTTSPHLARVEHRIGSADLNPYLALAVILAGGITGLRHELTPPPAFTRTAWGLPEHFDRLPNTISKAADALAQDELLKEVMGASVVDYWVNTRRLEWLSFHTEGGDPESSAVSDWEYKRYFEVL